jgi:omega-6 fatty acid desaturase (delta-12 desaturase)
MALKISDYVKVIPRDLWVPQERKSLMTLFRCLTLVVLSQLFLWYIPEISFQNAIWAVPAYLTLSLFGGLSLVSLFVLVHDCGHYSFSKNKLLNDLVGFFSFALLLNSFYGWRRAHDFHHRNNQVRRIDPDWPELLSTKEELKIIPWYERIAIRLGPGSPVGLLIGFWVGMFKRLFFSFLIPQMKLTKEETLILYFQNFLSAVFSALFLYFYIKLIGIDKFVFVYFGPVIVATTTGAFLTFIQHSHPGNFAFDQGSFDVVLSQVHSTVNVRFPRLLEYLWLDINIHLPHHILAGIPWYHLRAANESLKASYPSDVKEVDFSFSLLQRCWKATELKEISSGVYMLTERSSI